MKARHEFNYSEDYQRYIRTYIAAQAMQGLLSIHDDNMEVVPNESNVIYMAKLAVKSADILLDELSKPQLK